MSPPASPRTAIRSTRRRCSASFSTASAGATTERSGAANSCSPTIAASNGSARFKPVAMLGGAQAAREPWRNLYAHLMAEMGWAEFAMNFAELDVYADLARAAARDARRDDPQRRQLADGLVVRPAVRRGRRGARTSAASARPMRARPARGWRRSSIEDVLARRRRGAGYPLLHSQSARLRPALYRAAGDVAGDARRSHPEDAGAGDGGALPQGPRQSHRRDGEEAGAPRRRGRRRASTPSRLSGGCFQNRILFEEVVRRLEAGAFRRALACATSPPTTAASRSGRRRSAPRISSTPKRSRPTTVKPKG